MSFLSTKLFNFQVILSYLGLLPFIYVLLDIHIINIFLINILKDFIIYYTLLIFTFIGAMRWNFKILNNQFLILYGFIPSLTSTILIVFYIISKNQNMSLFLILVLLLFQIFFDFLISRNNNKEKPFFFSTRLPLTTIILLHIFYLIFV
tara:strand:+ start:1106 stop:1552 length:447 start_codon:yes stop_codon:yes gene_type:complete